MAELGDAASTIVAPDALVVCRGLFTRLSATNPLMSYEVKLELWRAGRADIVVSSWPRAAPHVGERFHRIRWRSPAEVAP